MFCIEHEKELQILPICEIASILNPKHKHARGLINAFNIQPRKIQRAILITESLKPYDYCAWEEIDKCISIFEKEIINKKYATKQFLYEGAKYFHRALEFYSDCKLDEVNPLIFNRKNGDYFCRHAKCSLKGFIEDYEVCIENNENELSPPFDYIWHEFDLGNCDEITLVFWVNRFIISACHCLHGFEHDMDQNTDWKDKDIVDESMLTTMEDLYYYAIFLLYKSYGNE